MPINFPSSPTLNQVYTVGTKTWVWNGYAWDIQSIDAIILGADTLARAAYGEANTQNVINQTQNTAIISINTFAQAAYNTANSGVLAQAAFDAANTASGNTVALQAQMTTTNTNIGYTDALATSAYGKANAEGAINNTQNNWIASTNTFAQAAYNTANLKFNTTGGTITGNVTIQNNLVVEGNLIVLGNSTTITTNDLSITDSLIFLANGNITTDALDIGFVGNYGGPSGETHTGFFRDPIQKEWILFEGYTQQVLSNTLINIANPTFAYANLYANVVKANLISTRATVNGLDVFSTMTNAWNSANAGVTLATAAYGQANNASGNTVALQSQMTTTNTNITSVNTFAGSAFNSANAGVTLATAAYGQANNASGNTVALQAVNTAQNTNITSINTLAGSAFNSANAGVTLATAAYGQANNASGNTVALQAVNTLQNTNITSVNTFAQAAYNEANAAVQTGFTTIAANSVNITPNSNADTLTITAGNNISISACTTTRTITINSTASGGGGGSGALTYDTSPPASGNTVGDRWVDSNDGTMYTYINDGNSSQWVDFSTSATSASVGGGSANAILYQAAVGNTTFTSVGTQGQLLMAGVGGVPIWAAQTALRIANTQITGLITNAQLAGPVGATITNETANSTTHYPLFSATISGTLSDVDVSSTKLTYVPSTGTLSSTVITSTSDEKLKTNISTIQNPIDTIKQLRGVEYNWKDNGQKSMGVIAQEVEKTLPYLVVESNDGKSVMYQNMIGLLIEAIKEQQKQIDELRGKLNAN
jgi:hypothetical protein